MDSTQYFFEVRNSVFAKAAETFAALFHSPKFDRSALRAELEGVDSEFKKNIGDDRRRALNIFRLGSNPASAFNTFSTGNLDTLDRPGLFGRLNGFYRQNYRWVGVAVRPRSSGISQ